MKLFIFVSTLFFGAYLNADDHKEIHFYNVPNSDDNYCSKLADELKNRLGKLGDVDVKASLCEYTRSTQRYSIKLTYSSPERLRVTSTFSLRNVYPARGLYRSNSECQKYLPAEISLFEKQTGLKHFAAFCSYARLAQTWKWYPNITAVGGEAKAIPDRVEWRSGSPYGTSYSELLDVFRNRLTDLTVTHFRFRPSATLGRATLHYFSNSSDEPLRFGASPMVTISGLDRCVDEARKFNAKANEVLGKHVVAYCSSNYSNPSRFQLTQVVRGWNQDVDPSAESFASYSNCMNRIEDVTSNYQLSYPDRKFVAICGQEPYGLDRRNPYRVHIVY